MNETHLSSSCTLTPFLSEVLIEHKPNNTQRRYLWGGPAGLLYEIQTDSSGAETSVRYYHSDQAGSTLALTDSAGEVTGRAEYTPYGVISHTSGVMDTPYLFNGAYGVQTDFQTGLIHMRARYYHPWLGRFLSEDPIQFEGGMNWFAYCGGDPLMRIDPDGELWFLVGAVIGGGLDYAAQVAANYANGQSGSSAWTNVNVTSIAISAGAGALTGGIGGMASKQVATIGGRAAVNAIANGTVSGAAQVAKNYAGVNGDAGRANLLNGVEGAVAFGALTGGVASVGGDLAGNAAQNFAQAQWFKGSELARQLSVNNAVSGLGRGWVTQIDESANTFFGVTGNFISNSPYNPIGSWSPFGLNTPPATTSSRGPVK